MIGQRSVSEFLPRMQVGIAERFVVEPDAQECTLTRAARSARGIGSGLKSVMVCPDFHGRRKARARRSPKDACKAAAWAKSWLVSRAGCASRQARANHQASGKVMSGSKKAQR